MLVGGGQQEHGEALRQVFLQPGGELGCALGKMRDDSFEPLLGRRTGGAFKNAADGTGHFGPLIQTRDVSLSVLLEVELAALPGDGTKDGFAGGSHAGVIVADNERDAVEAALDEALEGGAPMRFGFTEGDAHAEDDALACGSDAQRDEDGTVAEVTVVADFFVAGVEPQIGTSSQRTVPPFVEFGVEAFGAVAGVTGQAEGRGKAVLGFFNLPGRAREVDKALVQRVEQCGFAGAAGNLSGLGLISTNLGRN